METNDSGMKDFEEYKQQRKQILKQIQVHSPKQMSVESKDFTFHILTDSGVCYLTLCEKGTSAQLVFSFLNELKKEFSSLHGSEVEKVERPYAFITFDKFINDTAKMYSDTRNARNLKKLYEELGDVQQIMKKNIKDLLDRGDKLTDLEKNSSKVMDGTREFKKNATWLNRMHCIRTYYPVVIVLFIIFLVLVIRWKYY